MYHVNQNKLRIGGMSMCPIKQGGKVQLILQSRSCSFLLLSESSKIRKMHDFPTRQCIKYIEFHQLCRMHSAGSLLRTILIIIS